MSILSLGIGKSRDAQEKSYRKTLVETYSNLGGVNLLEGLKDTLKDNVAFLLENTAVELNRQHKMNETTTSASSGSFETVSFMMVRRIFGALLINEIASVQAMTAPSSSIFYFYPQISDRTVELDSNNNISRGHTAYSKFIPACVGHNCPDTTFENCKSLYDRPYNDQMFDHSKGRYAIITATGQNIVIDREGCTQPATSLRLSSDGSIRTAMFAVSGFDGSNPGTSRGHTARLGAKGGRGLEIDTQEFLSTFDIVYVGSTPILDAYGNVLYTSGDSIDYRMVANRYGKHLVDYNNYCDADGNLLVELEFMNAVTDCDTCPTFDGFIGAASGTNIATEDIAFTWRRYEDLEEENEIGSITFTIEKQMVSAAPRKLNARWTPELAADVNAYHNIDAEAELTALLSQQVAMEVDREALLILKKGAAWRLRWDYLGWKQQGSQKYTEKEWKQTLITRINQISAQIHKTTLRGGANFLVVSSEVSALFDDLEMFSVSDAEAGNTTYNLGMYKAGTIRGRYKVYVDPYCKPFDILIGHKGTSLLDTGFIYSPYIPVALSPVLQDTNNFTYVRQISTRYAMTMINNKYYGYIRVANIPTFDTNELR